MRAPRLIDRDHLDSQTFGDAELAAELLQLFADQCRRLLPGIAGGDAAATRADLAHTLKGSALGVGAARVAAISARVEDALRRDGAADGALLATLDAAVADTLAEVGRHGG